MKYPQTYFPVLSQYTPEPNFLHLWTHATLETFHDFAKAVPLSCLYFIFSCQFFLSIFQNSHHAICNSFEEAEIALENLGKNKHFSTKLLSKLHFPVISQRNWLSAAVFGVYLARVGLVLHFLNLPSSWRDIFLSLLAMKFCLSQMSCCQLV